MLQDFYTHLRCKDRQFAKLTGTDGEDFVLTGLLTAEGSSSAKDLRNLAGLPVSLLMEDQPDVGRLLPGRAPGDQRRQGIT